MKRLQSRLARVWSVLPLPKVSEIASSYVHSQQNPWESLCICQKPLEVVMRTIGWCCCHRRHLMLRPGMRVGTTSSQLCTSSLRTIASMQSPARVQRGPTVLCRQSANVHVQGHDRLRRRSLAWNVFVPEIIDRSKSARNIGARRVFEPATGGGGRPAGRIAGGAAVTARLYDHLRSCAQHGRANCVCLPSVVTLGSSRQYAALHPSYVSAEAL